MGRPIVNRVVQVGVETVPGTPVPANKSLPLTSIELQRELTVKQYRALGFKGQTAFKVTQDYSSGTMSGPFNYTEIVYPLATMVQPVITTPTNGVLTRDWLFTVKAQGADTFKTLTIQEGDGDAASQTAQSIFTQLGLDIKEDEAVLSGKILSKNMTSVSLTGSPTAIAQLPIGPREIDVFMDPIGGTIGTTKVTDAYMAQFGIDNKQVAKWVLNTSEASYKEPIEVVPTMSGLMCTEHNAQSRAFFNAITAVNNPYYLIRIKATGPQIEAVTPTYFYQAQIDFVSQIIATKQEDAGGVWGYSYTLVPAYHPTFGNKLFEALIRTTLTAL